MPGIRERRLGFLLAMSGENLRRAQNWYSFSTRFLYKFSSVPASMWTIAWTLLLPLDTTATHGSFIAWIMPSCFSTSSVSDSTRAYLNSVMFWLERPLPSIGLKQIHAPASGFQSPSTLPRSPPHLASSSRSSPAFLSQWPRFGIYLPSFS